MKNLFNINGLMFWDQREIRLRNRFSEHFAAEIENILWRENKAWKFFQCEAPLITPRNILNQNYTNADIWVQEPDASDTEGDCNACGAPLISDSIEPMALRPETTPGSYVYAQYLMNSNSGIKIPFCVWQIGKSFRREHDEIRHMRLKEFYQQEFQCIYAADTMNDYQQVILEPIKSLIQEIIGFEARIVESDRLPSYSLKTVDVEVYNNDKWMEICSISKRTDFPQKAKFTTKKGVVEKDIHVLEVAIGIDRCVYNYNLKNNINE